jgi:hypothetical protein
MTSNLEPAFGEVGKYESETFYPTVATTYSYRTFGNINGRIFDVTFSCLPAGGETAPSDNSTVQIFKNIVRKAFKVDLDVLISEMDSLNHIFRNMK